MQTGDEITQLPEEFAPTELPPTELAGLPISNSGSPCQTGNEIAQLPITQLPEELARTDVAPTEFPPTTLPPATPPPAQRSQLPVSNASSRCTNVFRWSIVRWGSVAVAAAAIAQIGSTLFHSLVAPTFAHKIEQAQTRSAGVKISAMNQAQQVYFLDHGTFSEELVSLDLGIVSQGQYYDYRIQFDRAVRSRSDRSPQARIVVNLALPREPGLPTIWGAIAAQGSGHQDKAHRTADSLICKKPAPDLQWSEKLRQQLQPKSIKHRSREAVPVLPRRLECPAGFEPASFSVYS